LLRNWSGTGFTFNRCGAILALGGENGGLIQATLQGNTLLQDNWLLWIKFKETRVEVHNRLSMCVVNTRAMEYASIDSL